MQYELLELMDITGFGPATLTTLHNKLQISTREELIKALEKEKLKGIKGFGDKKIDHIKLALKLHKQKQKAVIGRSYKNWQ